MMTSPQDQRFRDKTLPPVGEQVEVLYSYKSRLKTAPLLCSWSEDGWVIAGTRRKVPFEIVGWRPVQPKGTP